MPSICKLSEEVRRSLRRAQVCVTMPEIVKKLVENSLDAGATKISVVLRKHGLDGVEVVDNGSGIEEYDFEMMAEPQETSRIKSYEDLAALKTYGFRGKALSGLCSSSVVVTKTKVEGGTGYRLEFDSNGKCLLEKKKKDIAMNVGTRVEVIEPLCRHPVRREDFESNKREWLNKVVRILQAYALPRIDVAFELVNIISTRSVRKMVSPGPHADIGCAVSSVFSKKARSLRNTRKLEDAEISEEACELFRVDKTGTGFVEVGQVTLEGCIGELDAVKEAWRKSGRASGVLFVLQLTMPCSYFDVTSSPLRDKMECAIMDLVRAKIKEKGNRRVQRFGHSKGRTRAGGQLFQEIHKCRDFLAINSVENWVDNFLKIGNVEKVPVERGMAKLEKCKEEVGAIVKSDPKTSVRELSAITGSSIFTVWRASKAMKLHPYRMLRVQKLGSIFRIRAP
uniref:DNA_mis_repair domain-containing protein n=1 Tax=Strongyloides papillosus TaxID=174720 RepID=A0A0N5BZ46_STREA